MVKTMLNNSHLVIFAIFLKMAKWLLIPLVSGGYGGFRGFGAIGVFSSRESENGVKCVHCGGHCIRDRNAPQLKNIRRNSGEISVVRTLARFVRGRAIGRIRSDRGPAASVRGAAARKTAILYRARGEQNKISNQIY